MSYRVKTFTASDSAGMAVLMSPEGRPLFWPNTYVTSNFRNASKAVTTTTKLLRTLAMLYRWGDNCLPKLDIDQLLTKGEFISTSQVEDLALFLRMNAAGQKAWLNKPTNTKITNLEQVRGGLKKTPKEISYANPAEAAVRTRWVANYLEYHLNRRLGQRLRNSNQQNDIKDLGQACIGRLRALTPRATYSKEDESLEGIPEPMVLLAEQCMHPDSPNNPFSSPFGRNRNYLIWNLLLETGMRRDELRHLKTKDINYGSRTCKIKVSKTRPRTVPISQKLAELFHQFVMDYWTKLPAVARKNNYLFTSSKGKHIANVTINKIFEALRKKNPELPKHLSPHSLRRTWNDRLSRKFDAQNPRLPAEQEQAIRNRLMGWSDNSQMSARYSKRHIRAASDRIAQELVEELSKHREDYDTD